MIYHNKQISLHHYQIILCSLFFSTTTLSHLAVCFDRDHFRALFLRSLHCISNVFGISNAFEISMLPWTQKKTKSILEMKRSGVEGKKLLCFVRSYGKSLITSNIQTLFRRMRDIQLLVPWSFCWLRIFTGSLEKMDKILWLEILLRYVDWCLD